MRRWVPSNGRRWADGPPGHRHPDGLSQFAELDPPLGFCHFVEEFRQSGFVPFGQGLHAGMEGFKQRLGCGSEMFLDRLLVVFEFIAQLPACQVRHFDQGRTPLAQQVEKLAKARAVFDRSSRHPFQVGTNPFEEIVARQTFDVMLVESVQFGDVRSGGTAAHPRQGKGMGDLFQ